MHDMAQALVSVLIGIAQRCKNVASSISEEMKDRCCGTVRKVNAAKRATEYRYKLGNKRE